MIAGETKMTVIDVENNDAETVIYGSVSWDKQEVSGTEQVALPYTYVLATYEPEYSIPDGARVTVEGMTGEFTAYATRPEQEHITAHGETHHKTRTLIKAE